MASIEITEENPINVSLGEENTLTSSVSSPETVSVTSTDGWYEKKYDETDPIFEKSPASDITNEDIENWNNKSDFSGDYDDLENKPELFSGDYDDLENKPTIPNKTSDLTNDSGYSKIYYLSNDINNYTYAQISSLLNDGYEICLRVADYYVSAIGEPIANLVRCNQTLMDFAFVSAVYSETYRYTFANNTWSRETFDLVTDEIYDEIPYKTSQLTNDSGFLTEHQDISGKVDKETGKGLSTNDFTNAYKSNVDSNTTARHTHSNKSILDDISSNDVSNWDSKQDGLVSGTNIKTINNESILGSGNITIQGGSGGNAEWGSISGTLSDQTDLSTALGNKADSSSLSTVATSGSYNDLSNKPTIPTKTSDLTNDSGFLTQHQDISGKVDKETGKGLSTNDFTTAYKNNVDSNTSARHTHSNKSVLDGISSTDITNWNNKSTFSGSYNDLTNKPDIPKIFYVDTNTTTYTYNQMIGLVNDGYEIKAIIKDYTGNAIANIVYLSSSAMYFTFMDDDVVEGYTYSFNNNTWNVSETTLAHYSELPTKTSQLTNDSGFITSYTETDPTVPSWAKQNTKPSYQATEVSVDGSNLEQAGTSMVAIRSATETQEALRYISRAVKYNKEDIDTINNTSLPAKQDTLVSGTNIKTINSNSLLGSGDISFETIQDISESSVHIRDLYSGIYRIYGSCDVYYNSNDYLSVPSLGCAYLIVTEYEDTYTVKNWVFIGDGDPEFCYGYSWNNSGYCYNVTSEEAQEAITGILSNLTTTSKTNLVSAINELDSDKQDTLVSGTNIKTINNQSILGSGNLSILSGIDSYQFGNNGYIRFSNGLQIAWVEKQVSVTFQTWGNIYYADVSNMPSWAVPFTSVYQQHVTSNDKQCWFGCDEPTITSPSAIRILRATSGSRTVYIKVIAIGVWK